MKQYTRNFGAAKPNGDLYPDYTSSATDKQRDSYRDRHGGDIVQPKKDAAHYDDELYLASPGMLSYYILWGGTHDIRQNIREYKKMFLGGNFFGKDKQDVSERPVQSEEGSHGT